MTKISILGRYQTSQLGTDRYAAHQVYPPPAQASAGTYQEVVSQSQHQSGNVGGYFMVMRQILFLSFTRLTRASQVLPQVPYERGLRKEREPPRSDYGNSCRLASALVKDFTYLYDHAVEAFPGGTFAQRVSFVFHVREQSRPRNCHGLEMTSATVRGV